MFVNPSTPYHPMRRNLSNGLATGLGDMWSSFRDTVVAPIKVVVAVPIAAVIGASGGGGMTGAIQGAAGGFKYSAGDSSIYKPIAGAVTTMISPPQSRPGAAATLVTTGGDGLKWPIPIASSELPAKIPTVGAIVGQQSALNQPPPQASYGQLPYTPASRPGYDDNGNALPPPKKDVPWAAIATGSMAAVTLISALMNKHRD